MNHYTKVSVQSKTSEGEHQYFYIDRGSHDFVNCSSLLHYGASLKSYWFYSNFTVLVHCHSSHQNCF